MDAKRWTAEKETPYSECPRCHRATNGWLLRRADVCSPADWNACIRQPQAGWKRVPTPTFRLVKGYPWNHKVRFIKNDARGRALVRRLTA